MKHFGSLLQVENKEWSTPKEMLKVRMGREEKLAEDRLEILQWKVM